MGKSASSSVNPPVIIPNHNSSGSSRNVAGCCCPTDICLVIKPLIHLCCWSSRCHSNTEPNCGPQSSYAGAPHWSAVSEPRYWGS